MDTEAAGAVAPDTVVPGKDEHEKISSIKPIAFTCKSNKQQMQ